MNKKIIIILFLLLYSIFSYSFTPEEELLWGCESLEIEIVKNALEKGANPDTKNEKGNYALHEVIYSSVGREKIGEEIIKLLIEKKVKVNVKNNDGFTPLMVATLYNLPQIVSLLIENKAEPNIQDNKGWTALTIASRDTRIEIVKILLKAKANPNLKDKNGDTPIFHAINNCLSYDGIEIIKLLVKAGANINIKNNAGQKPLDLAKRNDEFGKDIIEILKKEGEKIH